jgi:hypothetical protein
MGMKGLAFIDGAAYRFMGRGSEPALTQTALEIRATASIYVFEGAGIRLELSFLSPLLLSDLDLLSRPLSYIGVKTGFTDGQRREVELEFHFDASFCKNTADPVPFTGGVHSLRGCEAAWMGRRRQAPLSHSGDDAAIDWGYLYVAVPQGRGRVFLSGDSDALRARLRCGEAETFIAAAYDDLVSINYFGEFRRGYWAREGKTICALIEEAARDYGAIRERCAAFDRELAEKAAAAGGDSYQRLLNLAYRQSIAAHKLITGENGEAVFISKECFSNGCAATVDVSYPSVPLYLLYNPELVKGMLRPIFRFARLPVWPFDFAPHDAGRFPYVTGQVYGLRDARMRNTETYPPYCVYPANADIYDPRCQMPVEECGNMLIMMAAVAKAEGNAEFSRPYQDLAEKWARYLEEFGSDPGEQLCTDDFAGRLASNCNLAVKAVMGLAAYALLLDFWGEGEKAVLYREKARVFAEGWKRRAVRGDHTALAFGREGWSLKYNMVWDKLLDCGLFGEAVYQREVQWYINQGNAYGVPLDSRRDDTKSDWILWAAAWTGDRAGREALIAPVAAFLRETPDRAPFPDWYDTVNAGHYHFRNRTVQGGLFMPLLADAWADR